MVRGGRVIATRGPGRPRQRLESKDVRRGRPIRHRMRTIPARAAPSAVWAASSGAEPRDGDGRRALARARRSSRAGCWLQFRAEPRRAQKNARPRPALGRGWSSRARAGPVRGVPAGADLEEPARADAPHEVEFAQPDAAPARLAAVHNDRNWGQHGNLSKVRATTPGCVEAAPSRASFRDH